MDVFALFAEEPLRLAAFLPAAAIVVVRPAWGLYWLLVLVGTNRALYAAGVLSVEVKVLADDGIVLAVLLGSVIRAARHRRMIPTEAGGPFLGLLLVTLISATANGTTPLTVVYGVRFALLYSLLFFAIRHLRPDDRSIRNVVGLTAALGALNAAIGIGQFLGVLPQWALYGEGRQLGWLLRASGLLGGPGDLGCYLVASMSLAWAMVVRGGAPRRPRNLLIGATILMGAGVMCTASRGPIVAMVVSGLVIVSLTRTSRRLVLVGALILASFVLTVPGLQERFAFLPREYDVGRTHRANRFYAAMGLVRIHPLLGIGMGVYGGSAGGYASEELDDRLGVAAQIDNFLLGLAVQIGIVGFAVFAWLVIRIVRAQARILRTHEGLPNGLAVASLAITAAMVPLSLAGTSLEQHAFAILFWGLPALASVAAERADMPSYGEPPADRHDAGPESELPVAAPSARQE